MFKLLLGNVYTGSDHNQHVGSDAKFQSKHVTSGAWGGGHGNMRIIANNEQFVPYCVIHVNHNTNGGTGSYFPGVKGKTKGGLTAEQRLKQNDSSSLGAAPKRALSNAVDPEQEAKMKKIKELESNRQETLKKEREKFKVIEEKVQTKNAAIVAADPQAATSGSVRASDRLMKELR